jgi:hypothetical protein
MGPAVIEDMTKVSRRPGTAPCAAAGLEMSSDDVLRLRGLVKLGQRSKSCLSSNKSGSPDTNHVDARLLVTQYSLRKAAQCPMLGHFILLRRQLFPHCIRGLLNSDNEFLSVSTQRVARPAACQDLALKLGAIRRILRIIRTD